MPWRCYLIKPTDRAAITLRRFTWSGSNDKCPNNPGWGHDASVTVETMPWPPHPEFLLNPREPAKPWSNGIEITFAHNDQRWPSNCSCGYEFCDGDEWDANLNRLYNGNRDGEIISGVFGNIGPKLPPGAMWYLNPDDGSPSTKHWLEGGRAGPDGKYLAVLLPRQLVWCIDGGAFENGQVKPCPWIREGAPPNVTATPSIDLRSLFHSHLTSGVILDDCEGRVFDSMGRLI